MFSRFKLTLKRRNIKQKILELEEEYYDEVEESFEKEEDIGVFLTEKASVPIEDVNVIYPVNPPFQFAQIVYDPDEMELLYKAIEPDLTQKEANYLSTINLLLDNIKVDPGMLVLEREKRLRDRVCEIIESYDMPLDGFQREKIIYTLLREYTGYGRIDVPMHDRYIEDISCNGPGDPLYIYHRIFESIRTNIVIDELDLNRFILKLAQSAGKYISISQPITDATLPDGSRINLTLGEEVTRKGSTFTIRKFKHDPISPIELMKYGSVSAELFAFLWILLQYNRSILISGSTAAGKTTFLNALCMFLNKEAKIVSIEDTAEINIYHDNWIQSVARVGFGGGQGGESGISGISGIQRRSGDITLYDLLAAALRQRPDYIIVGEVRGGEAYTMFQAISVGHPSLGTIHSGSLPELMSRIESNPMNVPRPLFASLDAVVFTSIVPGRVREDQKERRKMRRVKSVVEILDLDLDTNDLMTNEVVRWEPADDSFRFTKSFLFEEIHQEFGVKERELQEEMKRRAEVLDYLSEMNITDFRDVTRLIQSYHINPDEIFDMIEEVAP
ncbi:MAG: type II secretion system protein E [Candidatus Syntrophoarchaeum butanivorans]|uniref:Type II secretion system protein E n=1 Tax=Candidatus Syntropharchaeum butanivorans TaxID=1839936 RepID=A0A1F2P2X1_9EURY|nr:MAG: type II secretion system protein E [Candidatus Syntrophoarchaeum butanivorans]